MKPEEIKIGTKFIYKGIDWNHHHNIIQTIMDIKYVITHNTTFVNIYTDIDENFYFDISSSHMDECEAINSPQIQIK